jgi:septal ring factor EnvC (AmiA/AmiB activator)
MNTWGIVQAVVYLLGVLTVLLIASSLLVLAVKRKFNEQTIKELQNLSAARLERINQVTDENSHLQRTLESVREHVDECDRKLNDFAANNLRLNARLVSYEKCINALESINGRPLTNFDDPFRDRK